MRITGSPKILHSVNSTVATVPHPPNLSTLPPPLSRREIKKLDFGWDRFYGNYQPVVLDSDFGVVNASPDAPVAHRDGFL